MRFLSRRISARSDRGFTVIEMMIVTALLLVIVTSMLAVFASMQRSQAFQQERSQSLDEMRSTMSRLTKEIRQTESIHEDSDADWLQIDTYVLGEPQTVRYEAAGTELRREVVGSGSTTVLEEELASTAIFSYTLPTVDSPVEEATVIALDLRVAPERLPETVLTLESEVRLRNVGGAE